MHRGYYKAWRKITDSVSWSRGLEYRGLMHSILARANYKATPFRGEMIPAGAFAVVLTSWAGELGVTRQKLQRMLKTLAGDPDRFINVENVGNRFSIITVCNWGVYQEDKAHERATAVTTDERPAGDHRATTGQQKKKVKNIRNSPGNSDEQPEVSWRDEADGDVLKFVERFQQFVEQEHGKKAPKLSDSLIRKGVDTLDKLIRLDGFDLETIRAAMLWAVKDEFWQKNVLSLAALRKKNADGVMKFQQILARYESEAGESDEPDQFEGWVDWTDEQIAALPPLGG
jgi:hypothetical protein